MSDKVAIVTGSNKGIGFAIVKGLCHRFDGVVYLTSRDEKRGKEAVDKLKNILLNPLYHQLDVADKESVRRFSEHIKEQYGGIDILINNAGVSGTFENSYEGKKSVIDINYKSLLNIEAYLFPLLRNNARVVNVSSDCGHLSNVKNKEWIERLSKKDLSREDIDDFVNWYLDAERSGTFNRNDLAGWTIPAYRVSKVAMCALTMIQQRELEPRDISVNSCHPGLVRTDMTMHIGAFTPDESAEMPLYLVLDAPPSLKGKYIWFNKEEVDWYDYKNECYFEASSMGTALVMMAFKYLFKSIGIGVLSFVIVLGIVKYNDMFIELSGFENLK